MAKQHGVIFQAVPEEVAQAIDHLSQTFQLPADRIVKAGISFLLLLQQTNNPELYRMMDMVKADFERSIDRVLI